MISMEYSTIQAKQAERAGLDEALAEFFNAGGQIQAVESRFNPQSYFNSRAVMAPQAEPTKRKPSATLINAERFAKNQEAAKARQAFVAKVREMAATMTQGECAQALGVSRRKLYDIVQAYGVEFKAPNMAREQADPVEDAKTIERLLAMRDIGLTRNQARLRIGIATSTLYRLFKKYDIDFPVARKGVSDHG